MDGRNVDLKKCKWGMEFYDKRRFDNSLSEIQREIAKKYYKAYHILYNKMRKALEEERK